MLRGNQGRYALLGASLGLLLNLFAFLVDAIMAGLPLSWATFVQQHQSEPLHWVIDVGPILLAYIFGQIGKRQDKLDELNTQLQQRIEEATREMASEKQFFETLLRNNPLAIVVLDENENILSINHAFESLFQYSLDEVAGKRLDQLITDASSHLEAVGLTKAVLEGESIKSKGTRLRKDGTGIPVEIYGVQVMFAGSKIGALAIYQDISDRMAFETRLAQLLQETNELAKTDALTDLWNRRAITQMAVSELSRAKRMKEPLSLILLDLDRFKQVNDRFGHQEGDKALNKIAQLLKDNMRGYDGLGRWGGDEFIVVLPKTNQVTATNIGERLIQLASEISVSPDSNEEAHLSISLGIATFDPEQDEDNDIDSLVRIADEHLYRAKAARKNQTTQTE